MLGSRLARRIVVPVLLLIGVLFALLGAAAVRIANVRVTEELEEEADRIARTLDAEPVAPAQRRVILPLLARLVGADLVVGDHATHPDWDQASVSGGRVTLGGARYRVLERHSARGPELYRILTAEERITRRRWDVLAPVLAAGAVGLLVAVVLGLVVARTIARPVKRLADQAQAFAAGRYEGDGGGKGPGEIGELSESFERMVLAIREGEAKLRESERFAALGRLAGGIAHELRNPLTAIRMAVETSVDDDEARRIALSEIERLDRTLRELLDFVRPRQPQLDDVDVAGLFDDVVQLLGPQCDHLEVRLEADAPSGLSLRADRDRLKQALLNLVLNAAQAQPCGGVVRLSGKPGRVEVADEGAGIPEDVRETLTQPFVTTKAAGIGLGLAVVKQVADEHGAALDFRTGPGGTTFTLRFP